MLKYGRITIRKNKTKQTKRQTYRKVGAQSQGSKEAIYDSRLPNFGIRKDSIGFYPKESFFVCLAL